MSSIDLQHPEKCHAPDWICMIHAYDCPCEGGCMFSFCHILWIWICCPACTYQMTTCTSNPVRVHPHHFPVFDARMYLSPFRSANLKRRYHGSRAERDSPPLAGGLPAAGADPRHPDEEAERGQALPVRLQHAQGLPLRAAQPAQQVHLEAQRRQEGLSPHQGGSVSGSRAWIARSVVHLGQWANFDIVPDLVQREPKFTDPLQFPKILISLLILGFY